MFKRIAILGLSFFSFACASQRIVSEPSKISLEEAMASVGKSFVALRDAKQGLELGLIPTEISVTFNVAASGQDNSKLVLDLNPTGVKTGGEVSSQSTASRGNQITIKFQHIFLLPKDSFGQRPIKDIQDLVALVRGWGWVTLR